MPLYISLVVLLTQPTGVRESDSTTHGHGIKAIREAVQTDLFDVQGMKTATDIVVSGCSAGGLATYLACDAWAAQALAVVKVRKTPSWPRSWANFSLS